MMKIMEGERLRRNISTSVSTPTTPTTPDDTGSVPKGRRSQKGIKGERVKRLVLDLE